MMKKEVKYIIYYYKFNSSALLRRYHLKGILLDVHFHLPGVFINNLGDTGVNGSLWTLPVEFTMYLVILCLGFIGLKKRRWLLVLLASICIAFFVNTNYGVDTTLINNSIEISGFKSLLSGLLINGDITILFLIGGLLYLYKDRVIYNQYLFFILSFIWIISLTSNYIKLTNFLCLPYIVISLAFVPSNILPKVSNYGDFSYGLYIYSFVVQQTILHYIPQLNFRPYLFLVISLPISLCCAYLSWHLIESKALKLKNITFLRNRRWKMSNNRADL
jgi:peptidoglycan/LPS O-acetylase OafA/YrhL